MKGHLPCKDTFDTEVSLEGRDHYTIISRCQVSGGIGPLQIPVSVHLINHILDTEVSVKCGMGTALIHKYNCDNLR
jgi:hypothetical protein